MIHILFKNSCYDNCSEHWDFHVVKEKRVLFLQPPSLLLQTKVSSSVAFKMLTSGYKCKTKQSSHSQWVIHELAFCPRYFSSLVLLKGFEGKKS